MCQCDPTRRTPYCGIGNCVPPTLPKLDQNNHRHGMGKYAIINLRKIKTEIVTPREVAFAAYQEPELLDLGLKGSDSEFFVIRLKDNHAVPALTAYADSVESTNPILAKEVRELIERARVHPNKKHPD